MAEWLFILIQGAAFRQFFVLAVVGIVCWICLLSIRRSPSVGWLSGLVGSPIMLGLLVVGAIVSPVIFVVLLGELVFVPLLVVLLVLFVLRVVLHRGIRSSVLARRWEVCSVSDGREKRAAPIVGNIEKNIYHRNGPSGCKYQLKLNRGKRVYFDSAEAAGAQGYNPCKCCFTERGAPQDADEPM